MLFKLYLLGFTEVLLKIILKNYGRHNGETVNCCKPNNNCPNIQLVDYVDVATIRGAVAVGANSASLWIIISR
ncbi:MAG: hypothetical protein AMK70_13120 [Nitrospira bacterium SG8_35_1]|nr:MAG: hypothetical protein AMK70_13120 [Nitrospira bacterium SG8_35_1]